MRSRFWLAYGALALAVALLAPTLAPLSGSMDAFADELANGTFRPFGPTSPDAAASGLSGSLGGLTGASMGDYVPGASDLPESWLMDRNGAAGTVVVDYVFDPALGAMKRLKAYDRIDADGRTLQVADTRLRPLAFDPYQPPDTLFEGEFKVQLRRGEPIPIFSPHPKAVIESYRTEPNVPGGVTFFKDGADTFYALGRTDALVTLHVTYLASRDYYDAPGAIRGAVSDYPPAVRPRLPDDLQADAQVVLSRAGVERSDELDDVVRKLNAYFRSFTEGAIPPPEEVEDLYLALALGGHGCCRHRAFAYMVTAQAVGIPTRVVVNEAHAFVELLTPAGQWHQINLGGCGTYRVNNPNDHPDFFEQAADPRDEANPDEARDLPVAITFTNITESPSRIVKGETYHVNGTVEGPDGRPVAGARIDVYLNETKDAQGRLSGAGTTDAQGRYSVVARVPGDLPARSYQLVARAAEAVSNDVRYEESWSDPPVDVFTPTRFVFPQLRAAAGFPASVSGRLVDVDGTPVAGANLTWTADGVPQPSLTTDRTGGFTGTATFNQTGAKQVVFRYAGDEHHGTSVGNATVAVEEGAILIPTEAPVLHRGETGRLTGTLAVGGVDLGGHEVRVVLFPPDNGQEPFLSSYYGPGDTLRPPGSGSALTLPNGSFAIPVRIMEDLPPGIYPARYTAPDLDLSTDGLVRVALRASLDVNAPRAVGPGEDWIVEAYLTSDDGTAIAGGIVELTFDGNASTTRALLTNRTGYARFVVPSGEIEEGAHRMRVAFVGDQDHAPTELDVQVEVVRPWYRNIPPLAYAGLVAGAAVLVGLAWLLRRDGPGRRVLARMAPLFSRPNRWRLALAFPQHPIGVPPVFEPGETARVQALARDRRGRDVRARIVILWRGGRTRARAGGDAVDVPVPDQEGVLEITARARGFARLWTPPIKVRVPVHPYRRAVEEGYVALREAARLDPSASPRDLLDALDGRLGAEAARRLREAASLFEVADYSQEGVDRAFYHAFATARLVVEHDLRKPGGGAAGLA